MGIFRALVFGAIASALWAVAPIQASTDTAGSEEEGLATGAVEDKERLFIKLWTVADLAPLLKSDHTRPNFEVGRNIYTAAGCNKCHVVREEGIPIGPDLTKTAEKFKRVELLRQILEPSAIIEPQYIAYLFEMDDFTMLTGFIVEESKAAIKIKPTSIFAEEPLVIPLAEIKKIHKAPLSAMPTGILSTFTAAEILELLAYLEAGGDPDAEIYKNGARKTKP